MVMNFGYDRKDKIADTSGRNEFPPQGGWALPPGMSHREEALGKTQDTLERLCLSVGLGTPRESPQKSWRKCLGSDCCLHDPVSDKYGERVVLDEQVVNELVRTIINLQQEVISA
ncbi:hypothetical protein L3Q82_002471 [Scortum barcoo]|uniref:Uncharacterized protein n=1 Tax=Scortum barcoo TaxID=214431 RepID=A0ACB8VYE3_9TELE|nr:hypothetical protein L3Q82_002471 [Scortum barcoo]